MPASPAELLAPKLRDVFFRPGPNGEAIYIPSRYKVAHGGRGGGKSWGFAGVAALLGSFRRLRVLCARELQNSIQESIHRLLSDQIHRLGLDAYYDIQRQGIYGRNGTEFIFAGIKNDPGKIKSTEGIDIAIVEEADKVSRESWEVLIPTIRKPHSEIWVCFNPQEETDETYQRFVLEEPPDCRRVKIDWHENPWFPQVLDLERKAALARIEQANNKVSQARLLAAYEHIWEGKCRQLPTGSFFSEYSLLIDGKPIPTPTMASCVFATIDTAFKTGKENDGTGVVYWALSMHNHWPGYRLVILDYDYKQIDGAMLETWLPTVISRLDAYAKSIKTIAQPGSLGPFIEDKASGTVLLQQARNRGWRAHAINIKLSNMGKNERALSISNHVDVGQVKISETAYNRQVTYKGVTKQHLLSQVLQFSASKPELDLVEDDLLDCFSYGVALALGNPQGFG